MRSARSGSAARAAAAAGGWQLRVALSLLSQPAIVGAVDNGIGALRACSSVHSSFHSSRGGCGCGCLRCGWRCWRCGWRSRGSSALRSLTAPAAAQG